MIAAVAAALPALIDRADKSDLVLTAKLGPHSPEGPAATYVPVLLSGKLARGLHVVRDGDTLAVLDCGRADVAASACLLPEPGTGRTLTLRSDTDDHEVGLTELLPLLDGRVLRRHHTERVNWPVGWVYRITKIRRSVLTVSISTGDVMTFPWVSSKLSALVMTVLDKPASWTRPEPFQDLPGTAIYLLARPSIDGPSEFARVTELACDGSTYTLYRADDSLVFTVFSEVLGAPQAHVTVRLSPAEGTLLAANPGYARTLAEAIAAHPLDYQDRVVDIRNKTLRAGIVAGTVPVTLRASGDNSYLLYEHAEGYVLSVMCHVSSAYYSVELAMPASADISPPALELLALSVSTDNARYADRSLLLSGHLP